MNCPFCKATLAREARFCSVCGRPAADPAVPAPGAAGGHDLPTGYVLDAKYRIEGKLAGGPTSTVYRARRVALADGSVGDLVAVRVLRSDHAKDPMARDQLWRRALAVRLGHTSAVEIYDFGVSADGFEYFATEMVGGQTLREALRQRGSLPPSVAAEALDQICGALEEAHGQGIVHGDIKPENIMLDVVDRRVRVKVLDFETATLRDAFGRVGTPTEVDHVTGTPKYMSPEQCWGEELDGRSDVYSVGIVLFEMLAGVPPFNSPVPTAVVLQQVSQAPPKLRSMNAGVGEAVERVVERALAKRREERPQTARELAREFRAAMSAVAARASGPIPSATIPGPMPTSPLQARASVAESEAPARPPGSRTALIFFVLVGTVIAGGAAVWSLVHWQGREGDERPAAGAATGTTSPKPPENTTVAPAQPPADDRRAATSPPSAANVAETILAAETNDVVGAELATGGPDGRAARVKPGGTLALAFPAGMAIDDDGTTAPDLRVVGATGDPVSYKLEVRGPDGGFHRIDKRKEFGESDMHHHGIHSADAVRITNTGTADLLVDAVEAVRELEPE